jgi:hypothetical protein
LKHTTVGIASHVIAESVPQLGFHLWLWHLLFSFFGQFQFRNKNMKTSAKRNEKERRWWWPLARPPTFISVGLKDKKKRQKMSDKRIK